MFTGVQSALCFISWLLTVLVISLSYSTVEGKAKLFGTCPPRMIVRMAMITKWLTVNMDYMKNAKLMAVELRRLAKHS